MPDHDTREAEHNLQLLKGILNYQLPENTLCDDPGFWNTIMKEHAQFIDGMLDPTESDLKKAAQSTAKEFKKLIKECIRSAEEQILQESLNSAKKLSRHYLQTMC